MRRECAFQVGDGLRHSLIPIKIRNQLEGMYQKLFCGTLDPNPKINGRGIKLLKKNGIETSVGLLKNECKELNRVFFTNQKKSRPYIILKSAQKIWYVYILWSI